MMSRATGQEVKLGSLNDKAWALRQVVERASSVTLDDAERGYLNRVEDWVCKVDTLADRASTEKVIVAAPQLDLTRVQLRHLVTKVVIDQTPDLKRRRQLERLWPDGEPLRQHSRSLKITSWLVGAGLLSLALADVISLAIINLANVAILRDIPRSLALEVNLSLVVIASIFWAFHHFRTLLPHLESVEEHIMQELKMLQLI